MKTRKIITIVAVIYAFATTFAQAPQRMSYQSVVRNAANQIVANQSIGVKISIVEGSLTGTTVYAETHTTTTNANGLFTLEAGGGTPTTGTFSAINWGNGSHYIKSEIDVTGGTNYALSGTMELLSVPYALYAEKSGALATQNFTSDGTFIPTAISNRSPTALQYTQSIKYCADLVESGFSDWRLPKQEEIEEYIFNSGNIPAIGISTWIRGNFVNSGASGNYPYPGTTFYSAGWTYYIDSLGNGEVRPHELATGGSQANTYTCHCIR